MYFQTRSRSGEDAAVLSLRGFAAIRRLSTRTKCRRLLTVCKYAIQPTSLRTSGSFFYMVLGRTVSLTVVDIGVCGFAAVGGSPHALSVGVSVRFETILHAHQPPNFREFFTIGGMKNLLLINLLFQGHQLLHFQDNCCTICPHVNS